MVQAFKKHSQFELLRQRRFLPFFVTQCFGAFNDNVFRQAIIGLLFWMEASPEQRTLYASLAPAIFILPYFLFSAIAGQIAEKLEKSTLIRITTSMEIAIMALAAVAFVLQALPLLLVALFLTGVQSTLFGPVKYSILPTVLRPEELTGGNGLVEMGTSVSILVGMIAGGMIFELAGASGPWAAGGCVIGLAIAGNLVSRMIPRAAAGAPDLKINWNPVPETVAVLRMARKQLAVRNSVLGISWFWFVGTVFATQLPDYAVLNLGGSATLYVFALALFSIGTGAGSMLCEKLSARTVEIGLVPLGAFGMSAFLFDLYFARSGTVAAAGLDIAGFLQQAGSWRIVLDLLGIGVFTGFFVVPLFALVQTRTPKDELSRTIGALNIQNSAFVVAASLTCLALRQWADWSIPQLFLALAVANTLVAIWIFSIVPEFLMRFLSWVLVRTLYRLRVRGVEEHVPDEGPAVLVCNHVSYVDALVLSAAIPRPVRWVMYHRIFDIPVLSWIFRNARAIPIAGAREDSALMQRAFDTIDAALADGELIGIFPEGALTKDGNIAPFKSGVERILERRPVPVVPLALRGLWASMWSRRGTLPGSSRLSRMRVPRRFRAHVELHAGPPMPADTTADELEAKVRELRGDAA